MVKDQLINILFSVFVKYSSLRVVSGAILGLSRKTKHFNYLRSAEKLANLSCYFRGSLLLVFISFKICLY
jgi:hypothetical protein